MLAQRAVCAARNANSEAAVMHLWYVAVIYAWVQQRTAHILREETMMRSCTAAIAGVGLFSSISFVHAEPLPTETFRILPAALAVEAAQAAIASCRTQGYTVSVAIVDRAGNLKLLLVGDGA